MGINKFDKIKESVENLPLNYEIIWSIDRELVFQLYESKKTNDLNGDDLAVFRINEVSRFMMKYFNILKQSYKQSAECAHVMFPYIWKSQKEETQDWIDKIIRKSNRAIRKFDKEFPNPTDEQQRLFDKEIGEIESGLNEAYQTILDLGDRQINYDKFRKVSEELKSLVEFDEDENMLEEAESIQKLQDSIFYEDDEEVSHLTGETGVFATMVFLSRIREVSEINLVN